MKSITAVSATLCILLFSGSCTSTSKGSTTRYFGEGGSSQDTLFVRATDSPVAFIIERNYAAGGEGGSSQDTLFLKPKETARFYKMRDDKDKKKQ